MKRRVVTQPSPLVPPISMPRPSAVASYAGKHLADDLPFVEHDEPIGQRQQLVEILGDEQDCGAFGPLRQDVLAHRLRCPDVEPSVGERAIRTLGLALTSRAINAFWRFPPESRRIGKPGRTPRMSYFSIISAPRSLKAPFASQGPREYGDFRNALRPRLSSVVSPGARPMPSLLCGT